jgi:hypothetical protein
VGVGIDESTAVVVDRPVFHGHRQKRRHDHRRPPCGDGPVYGGRARSSIQCIGLRPPTGDEVRPGSAGHAGAWMSEQPFATCDPINAPGQLMSSGAPEQDKDGQSSVKAAHAPKPISHAVTVHGPAVNTGQTQARPQRSVVRGCTTFFPFPSTTSAQIPGPEGCYARCGACSSRPRIEKR